MTTPRHRTTAAVGGALALAAAMVATAAPAAASEEHSPAELIAQITGPGSINDTDTRWAVTGTDLGLMWDNGQGEILFAIGDTFGEWTGPGGGGEDWRSNGLLRSTDTDFTTGMSLDSAVEDEPGHAAEIIPSLKEPGVEHTTIPTAGIAVGDRQYLAFMSVREWGEPGEWDTNFSRIAYSDDNGETWNHTDGPEWTNTADGDHPFQMVSFVRGLDDDFIYMHGTPNGRLGAAHVARVPEDQIEDKEAYSYWDGNAWILGDDTAAEPVVPPNVSELSVQFHEHSGHWLMMYLDEETDVVVRTAPQPQGPWSDSQVVASFADYPGLYSPYMHPWNSGPTVHFVMSQWDPYNIFQLAFEVDDEGQVTNPNLIADPSFERAGDGPMTDVWSCTGPCGIDHNHTWAYAGNNQAWMRHNAGWIDIHQDVEVEPYTTYTFSSFLTTGGAPGDGAFGVRQPGPGGADIAEDGFTEVDGHERHSLTFNSGPHSTVQVYVGTQLDGDRWVQIDDLALVRTAEQQSVWELTKTADPVSGAEVSAGDVLTYTIEATSVGAIPAATISDELGDVTDDAELLEVEVSHGQVELLDGNLTWTGALAADQPLTLTYQVEVGADGERGDSVLANSVTGEADGAVLVDCETCWSTEHTAVDSGTDPSPPPTSPEEPGEDPGDGPGDGSGGGTGGPSDPTPPGVGSGSGGGGQALPETGAPTAALIALAGIVTFAGVALVTLLRRRAQT